MSPQRRSSGRWRMVCGLASALALIAPVASSTEALCVAENGGERLELRVPASADPFEFHSVEFDQRFRLSAQYLSSANKLKTYVYDFRGDTAVVIHAAEYALADADCRSHGEGKGFGLHRVYSRHYEREMALQCHAVCD